MGLEEIHNPVCTIREGFLEEVVSQEGRKSRSQLGQGKDRRKYPGVTGFQTQLLMTKTEERSHVGAPKGETLSQPGPGGSRKVSCMRRHLS